MGAHQQVIDLRHQALGAEGAPVGVTHVLQNVLRDFAPALLGHEDLVAFLLSAVISHAKIQQAPAQTQPIEFAIAFFGGGCAQAFLAVFDTDGGTPGVIVTPGVTRRGHQPWQHLVAGDITQVAGQRAFHQFEAVVQVVFQGLRGRFVEGDGFGDRLLIGIHLRLVADDPLSGFILAVLMRFGRRTCGQQEGGGDGRTEQRLRQSWHSQSLVFAHSRVRLSSARKRSAASRN
ncbi:hypothetical protein D3C76_1129980 [compost metagenome]